MPVRPLADISYQGMHWHIATITYKAGQLPLKEGCVPDAFKTAVVTTLIKKENLPSDDLKNYCPVSGLSFISKLVECMVAKQLSEHIHVYNLDNPYQSAYKASNSTEIALSIKMKFTYLCKEVNPLH